MSYSTYTKLVLRLASKMMNFSQFSFFLKGFFVQAITDKPYSTSPSYAHSSLLFLRKWKHNESFGHVVLCTARSIVLFFYLHQLHHGRKKQKGIMP